MQTLSNKYKKVIFKGYPFRLLPPAIINQPTLLLVILCFPPYAKWPGGFLLRLRVLTYLRGKICISFHREFANEMLYNIIIN